MRSCPSSCERNLIQPIEVTWIKFKELVTEITALHQSLHSIEKIFSTVRAVSTQVGINNTNDDRIALSPHNSPPPWVLEHGDIVHKWITTIANAQLMLDGVDQALSKINTRRSYLGAIQNRLESAVSSMSNQHENLISASSQIIDVDYAEESANMVRLQIQQQAAMASLSQARSITQSIVSLLS